MPFVRTILRRPVVDSTNGLARSLLLQGARRASLPRLGRQQTLGRGRGDNQWWSDEGSLTFTIALDPAAHGLRIDQEPRLALMTAVAVIEAISTLGLTAPGIGIRWPNDIEATAASSAGSFPSGSRPSRPSPAHRHRPQCPDPHRSGAASVQQMATSLSALQPQPLEPSFLPRLLAAILAQFERDSDRLAGEDPELAQQWNRLNLLHDQVVRVALGPRVIEGTVHEIDAQGALACTTASRFIGSSAGRCCAILRMTRA